MVRFYSEEDELRIVPNADIWKILGAVDAFLRTQAKDPYRLVARDDRGWVSTGTVADLRRECDEHGNPINSFILYYGEKSEREAWFVFSVHNLDSTAPHLSPSLPRIRVEGNGLDAARIRGAVAEVADRAKLAQPPANALFDTQGDGPNSSSDGATGKPDRVYTAREKSDFEADRAWVILELADAAARVELEGEFKTEVSVYDERGRFEAASVHEARVLWEKDRLPVEQMSIMYFSNTGFETTPYISCEGLTRERTKYSSGPSLRVRVTSPRFEDAQRLAAKIARVANTETDTTPQDDPPADPTPSSGPVGEVVPAVSASLSAAMPQPRWKRILNHQYAVQIIGGGAAGLLILGLTLLLSQQR